MPPAAISSPAPIYKVATQLQTFGMEKNKMETNRFNDDYCDLPEPLRPVALSCDRIIQDDREFNVYLVELVYLGLRPSYAMWLYCRRFRLERVRDR